MAIPAVNQKYLLTFVGRLNGQTVLNTFWYDLFTVGPAASVEAVYDVIDAQVFAGGGLQQKFLAVCPDNYTLEQKWIQLIWPTRIMKRVLASNTAGTWLNGADTPNLASVITRRAEIADKHSVSTLHIPLPDPAVILTEGVITNAPYLAALQALAAEMKDDLVGPGAPATTLRPVIFNPAQEAPPSTRYIVQTVVNTTSRVMRRRTVGLGI
jgi:hypothetical protein